MNQKNVVINKTPTLNPIASNVCSKNKTPTTAKLICKNKKQMNHKKQNWEKRLESKNLEPILNKMKTTKHKDIYGNIKIYLVLESTGLFVET